MKRLHHPALLLTCLCGLLPSALPWATYASEDDASELVVIRAGRVITISGQTYRPGMVVIEGGKVRAVGQRLDYPRSAKVIDARSETVMPGLILARSRYGLDSYSRSGLHGKEKAAGELFLSEIEFEGLLRAGCTMVAYIPQGTGIPGVASIVRTGGPEGPQLLRESSYLRVTMTSPSRDKGGLRSALATARKEIEKVEKARSEWEKKQKEAQEKAAKENREPEKKTQAKDQEKSPTPRAEQEKGAAKSSAFKPPRIDPNVQPLVDLLEKKEGASVVFELARASDLLHLDSVLEEYSQIKGHYQLAPSSSSDFHHVVETLGERKAQLVMSPLLGWIPYTVNDTNLAAEFARAGCEVVFVPRRDTESELRDLLTDVANVVRSGLTRKTALAALTLHAARFLDLDDDYGSLEKGKEADIIFLSGDPLSPERRVRRVMIGGEIIWEEPAR